MKTPKSKMYVIRKYVMATSVAQAIRQDHKTDVHEIFIDEKWQEKNLADAIGFIQQPPKTDE